jgi:hypothetical protein
MALVKGTNAYVSMVEADAYFATRLDVLAWQAADVTMREQAIVTAAVVLDNLRWEGCVLDEFQPLAWPRTCSYFDPRLGMQVITDVAVPKRITDANFELAYHLLNNDGLLDESGRVHDIALGGISLSSVIPTSLIPPTVSRLIRPLLMNAGARSWWRAN